ncbi:unnamed protein product [Leptidea sinapis]|uniref:Uncharacterized protein n=1 Tax=Leptidea sinapis TaxID=189913 RepID=A0A5E4Q694_9NEOP|nr:unnamed protein product [Leptidea sinapis]
MRLLYKEILLQSRRTFKKFGHKQQPVPAITVLWHGFLTFTFIGMGINWKRISRFMFGEEPNQEQTSPLSLK